MTDRYNQPDKGTEGWHIPINENFADLGVEVVDTVDRWADLPEPKGETSTNGNPKVYRVSADKIFVADTGNSWTIIGGLGSKKHPLPSVAVERLTTDEVRNTKNHGTIQVSHTRYVGPDDPTELDEFDVQDGDVWVKTRK